MHKANNHLRRIFLRIDPYLVLAALIGLVTAILRHGWKTLNPTEVGWLMSGFDSAQHFLGWHFFRREPWSFPPGIIQGYFAPIGTNIGLTDSIPLLAFLFKPLSPLLPANFQYLGAWLFFTFILQAIFGYLLIGLFVEKRGLRLLAGLFFLFSPIVYSRLFSYTGPFILEHIALSSYWVILAALWLYFKSLRTFNIRAFSLSWILLIAIVGLVHPYLTAMISLLALASLVTEVLQHRIKPIWALILALSFLAIILFEWWLTGYFHNTGVISSEAVKLRSMNLNSPINPLNTSRLLPGLPNYDEYQLEGYAFLGLGVILLALFVLIAIAFNWRKGENNIFLSKLTRHLPMIIILFLLFVLSLGDHITWGQRLIFTFEHPSSPINYIYTNFRAIGRFFGPIYFLIYLVVLVVTVRRFPYRMAAILLTACLLIQIADMKNLQPVRRPYTPRLTDPAWARLVEPFETLIPVPPYQYSLAFRNDFKDIAFLAANYGKTVKVGYVARWSIAEIERQQRQTARRLHQGKPATDALYLFSPQSYAEFLDDIRGTMSCHSIDGYVACYDNHRSIIP